MDFWKRAQELNDEITQSRRRIHQNAEVGLNLPNTKAFVMEKLREYGLKPTECGHGVTATLGKPGKTLLLRADMDALNIPNFTPYGGISATGSEDFALVAERVPSAMMYLGAGYMDERGQYTAHNPKVVFNEGVLPIGAACMAHCAVEWLKENA